MYPRLSLVCLVFCACLLRAEDGPYLQPLPQGPAQPAREPARVDVTNLRRERAQLQADREALSRRPALSAEDLSEERARLRRRLEELLKRMPTSKRAEAVHAPVEMPTLPMPRTVSHDTPEQGFKLPVPDLAETSEEKPATRNKPTHKPNSAGQKSEPEPIHAPKSLHPQQSSESHEPESEHETVVDPLGLAQSLFQTGDYEGALKAFRQVEVSSLKPQEKAGVHYLRATCLRKLGMFDEASALYQQVAATKADEMLADCARWQLSAIA